MKKFLTKIVIASIILTIAGWIVFKYFLQEYYIPVLPLLLAFFLITSSVIHTWQIKIAKKDLNKFTRTNMIATMIRLFIYSVVAVIYIANNPKNAVTFVICLMIIYLVFTFIEVTDLSRVAKSFNKNNSSKTG